MFCRVLQTLAMAGPQPKKKKQYKVRNFKSEWLTSYIDGVQVKTWLTQDPTNSKQGKCLICPAPEDAPFSGRTFAIGEGFTAITKHFNSKMHQKSSEEPNHNIDPREQIRIDQAFKNQAEVGQNDRKEKEYILQGQTIFSNMMHHHGVPSSVFTCFSKLAPVLFPDSKIAKKWAGGKTGFKATKGDYFLTHGIYPHQFEKMVKILQNSHFSLNFDEASLHKTSQMDLNVSYPKESEIVKDNFTTIDIKEGTTAEEVVDLIFGKLEEKRIPLENIVCVSLEGVGEIKQEKNQQFNVCINDFHQVTTDGCSTMLGEQNGVHALMRWDSVRYEIIICLRRRLPHLPKWGGCTCHDCSNILKVSCNQLEQKNIHPIPGWLRQAVPYDDQGLLHLVKPPELTVTSQVLQLLLTNQSFLRRREYERVCNQAGFAPNNIPTMCNTRFRMNIRFAEWMEKDDRCLYLWARNLRDDVESGQMKDVSEAVTTILQEYLCNYLTVRWSNMFFLDVSSPFLEVINHFEEEEPMIFKRWDVIFNLFNDVLAKFMKNAGGEDVAVTELFKLDFTDRKLQLDDSKIYLGGKVETFLKELSLTRQSPEIKPWLEKVRAFYAEIMRKIVKYFKPCLSSRTLQDLVILNPKSLFIYSLDELKDKWEYVAKKFPNIIKPNQIPELLGQVARLKVQGKMVEAVKELRPSEFFFKLSEVQEKYCLVAKLALPLLTPHNSSSCAERDISKMVRFDFLLFPGAYF